ncbi:MAG: hypothetical protein ACO1RA_16625 [Planctomycetaceae bacterium]
MSTTPAQFVSDSPSKETCGTDIGYWLGLPVRWARQMVGNGIDIFKVFDITRFRPMPAGLVSLSHPWVTGNNPETGRPIWFENVIYRSPRDTQRGLPSDETILLATGKFLAERVRQSAITPELPIGPKRRMPHAINYMHGSSHYNSGIILFNDMADGFRHVTNHRFRKEILRFVKAERREVLIIFRERNYRLRDFAYFSCCLRTTLPWFCNPNGPQGSVLWGNSAPYAAANLITRHWADDVYQLKSVNGQQAVVRPPIAPQAYFQEADYSTGRDYALWPEKLLTWATYWRVKARGAKGGMFFVDRRKNYADQIRNRQSRGVSDCPQAEL